MKFLTSAVFFAALAQAHPFATPDDFKSPRDLVSRSPLSDCIAGIGGNIEFLIPTSATYATLSRPFNLRLPYKPAVIVYPKSYDQASKSVKCGISSNVKISARGGGHSYGAFGLGGENGRLVIDLERYQSVVYNPANERAQVGAGLRLGNLAAKLATYGRALPHGTCAGVGIAGHALHGGFGYTSRLWGLTVDNIIEFKGIKADGSTFTANESTNKDLYWVSRARNQDRMQLTFE